MANKIRQSLPSSFKSISTSKNYNHVVDNSITKEWFHTLDGSLFLSSKSRCHRENHEHSMNPFLGQTYTIDYLFTIRPIGEIK